MATDLTENPSALRTGWKALPSQKPTASGAREKPAARGGRGSRGRGGRGSGRGRGAVVDAFAGFGSLGEDEPAAGPAVEDDAEPSATSKPAKQSAPVFERTPTQLELACDPADLALIRA
eukprot:6205298-Pleurochrysis_carterae.AAC.1